MDQQRRVVVARPHDRSGVGPELSLVIPSFNEEQRLPALLRALRDLKLEELELIIVDDGSSDDTVLVAHDEGAWCSALRVIEHGDNRGKGAAVRTGVNAARGTLIGFVDADNATDLGALAPMCDRVSGAVGAVFGSRHIAGATVVGSPPIRGVMGRVFNHVVRLAAGTAIRDTQCGAKVFRAPVARAVFSESNVDGFAFDVEVVRRLRALQVEVAEHPVFWTYKSGTKIRMLTPLRMLFDILRLRLIEPTFELAGFDTAWTDAHHRWADPLVGGAPMRDGEVVRVLVPDSCGPVESVRSRMQSETDTSS